MENETPENENDAVENPEEQAAEQAAAGSDADSDPQYAPDELGNGQQSDARAADVNLDLVLDVPVELSLRVGSTEISIRDLVSLVEGSVVSLDQDAGQPMDVLVNGTMIARGEIVVVDDQYGVRLTDVISPVERVEKLH